MPYAIVRHGLLRHLVELELPGPQVLRPGASCLIETRRGQELGRALATVPGPSQGERTARFLRLAEEPDELLAAELAARVQEDLVEARAVAAKAAPTARVIGGERVFSDDRLILYYASNRVFDVPALLRALHQALETEVLLEQLGARQRARACGGAGVCGRTLCCSTFLRRMQPVTMRMAKVQGVSLAPEVTAGLCGRLKCCLRYENPVYEDHRKGLPREGWWVLARRGEGTVVAVDVLRRQVLIRQEDGPRLRLFADEILESRPPRKPSGRLPVAGEELAEDDASEEEPVERGWSSLARRLWRRVSLGRTDDSETSRDDAPPLEEDADE